MIANVLQAWSRAHLLKKHPCKRIMLQTSLILEVTIPELRQACMCREFRNEISLADRSSKHTHVLLSKDLLLSEAFVWHNCTHCTPSLLSNVWYFCELTFHWKLVLAHAGDMHSR